MAWDNKHLLYSLQLQCNRLCSCGSLQVCMLLILANKFSLLLFFYKRLLVIARILWLGTHIFIMDSLTEKNLPGCHQILQIWSGLSSSVTTRTVYQKREWEVAHKLLIFFAFLSFSAYFYLFTWSRTPNIFHCFICWLLHSCFFWPLSSA